MTVDELKDKHFKAASYYWGDDKIHIEISIQFAIEVLKKMADDSLGPCLDCQYWENTFSKIQELKQYLDEEV